MFEHLPNALPWLILLIVITMALLKDICWKGLTRTFNTQLYHVIQETRTDKATRDFISSVYQMDQLTSPKRKMKRICCGGAEKEELEELIPKHVEEHQNEVVIEIRNNDVKEEKMVDPNPDEKQTGYAFTEMESGKTSVLEMAIVDEKPKEEVVHVHVQETI